VFTARYGMDLHTTYVTPNLEGLSVLPFSRTSCVVSCPFSAKTRRHGKSCTNPLSGMLSSRATTWSARSFSALPLNNCNSHQVWSPSHSVFFSTGLFKEVTCRYHRHSARNTRIRTAAFGHKHAEWSLAAAYQQHNTRTLCCKWCW